MFKRIILVGLAAIVFVAGCSNQDIARRQAEENAQNRQYYIPTHDVEGRNYDWRLKISDDPSLILWCTMFPPTPGVKPFTVPITGKLTSSTKRPFPTEPDAQGMYGTSDSYRYGFGPTGQFEYYDMFNLPAFCTTQPTVWQAELTVVVQDKDGGLVAASQRAHDLLAKGDTSGAARVLSEAIKKAQGGQ